MNLIKCFVFLQMDANNFLFPQDPRTTQFPQANRIDQFKEFEDVWDALPQGMTACLSCVVEVRGAYG